MNSTRNPNSWYSAPEVVVGEGLHHVEKWNCAPEVATGEGLHHIDERFEPPPLYGDRGSVERGNSTRICGLRSRSFWIIFSILAVVIVGAGVGGGIGGSIAMRNQSPGGSSSSASIIYPSTITISSPPISTPSSSSSNGSSSLTATKASSMLSVSLTTTQVISPTKTLFRDCPSSDGTLHDIRLGTVDYTFRKFCNQALVAIGDNVVSQATNDLNDCINQCAQHNFRTNSIGCNTVCWWNDFSTSQPGQCWGYPTQNSSSGFQYVVQPICDSAGLVSALNSTVKQQ